MDWQKWPECTSVPLLDREPQQSPVLPLSSAHSSSLDNSSSCSSTVSPPDRSLRDASGGNNVSQLLPPALLPEMTDVTVGTQTAPERSNIRLTVNENRYEQPPYNSTLPLMPTSTINVTEPHKMTCKWKKNCGQQFPTMNAILLHIQREHIQQSHEDNPHSKWSCKWEGCDEERKFAAPCNLVSHIRTHIGEKRYQCQFPGCGKVFSHIDALKVHKRCHTTEPYKCGFDNCDMIFNNTNSRTRHHNLIHLSKTTDFACPFEGCSKAYMNRSSVRKHFIKMHGKDEYEKSKVLCPSYFSSRRRPSQKPAEGIPRPNLAATPLSTHSDTPINWAQQQEKYLQTMLVQQQHVRSQLDQFTLPQQNMLTMNPLGQTPITPFFPSFPFFQMPAVFSSPPELLNPQSMKLQELLEQNSSSEENEDGTKKEEDNQPGENRLLPNGESRGDDGTSERRNSMTADNLQTDCDSEDEFIEVD